MRLSMLAVMVVFVSGFAVERALSQAAAESVLTHGLASGAGSSLGKTLGNALGNGAAQMGNRLGQQPLKAPLRQRVPAAKTTPTVVPKAEIPVPAASSSSGSLIASIQGSVSSTDSAPANCTPGMKSGNAVHAQSELPGTPTAENPPAPSGCRRSQDLDSHPAVVNLQPAN